MTTSFQLPIIKVQLSINDQLPMIDKAVAVVCELLSVNSMKIVNCEMKIKPTTGGA